MFNIPKGQRTSLQKSVDNKSPLKQTRPEIIVEEKKLEKKYPCSRCESSFDKLKGNFSASQSPLYKNHSESGVSYLPVCKSCLEDLYLHYVKVFADEHDAIRHMCMKFDIYFNESAYGASKKISADRNRMTGYISKINIFPHTGKSYDDTLDEERTIKIDSFDDLEELKENKKVKLTQKIIKFFGLGFEESEYEWLQYQYEDWISRHECKTKAQEELFKNICIVQLQIQKSTQKGDKIEQLMNTYQNLLGSANIKPAQINDNALTDQNTFGTLIKKWENEKPIPEPDSEWKDVDGIIRYISIWFLGHLCKMMNIKNSYSRLYEEEMEKYKVEKPQYEEDDELFFSNLFVEDNKNDIGDVND